MAGKTTLWPLDWHVDFDKALAVAYRLEAPNWLILCAFARLESGVIDLVGFRCDAYTRPIAEVPDAVQSIVETWDLDLPARGLTVNQLRVWVAGGNLLVKAREELRDVVVNWLPVAGHVREGRQVTEQRDDAFYARLAVVYAGLIGDDQGPARERLAAAVDEDWAGINTVKEWIKTARERGLWVTAGRRGVPGEASQVARAIYERGTK